MHGRHVSLQDVWKIIQEERIIDQTWEEIPWKRISQNDNAVESDEEWLTQDPGDLLGQVSSTGESYSNEGDESYEEKSEEVKEKSQAASNEDISVSEKEKHSAKPEP